MNATSTSRWVRRSLIGLLAMSALLLVSIAIVWNNLPPLPAITDNAVGNQRGTIYILAANGELIEQRGQNARRSIATEDLPVHLPAAVLAIEDEHFYRHLGFDPFAIVRALIANRQAGRIVQGASTITQQVAKLLYLQPERTWQRKYRELALALSLEQRYSKDEILALYLNNVYLGSGNYGVEDASWDYFGKSARDLNLAESAMLAGLLQAPSRYAPTRNLNKARARASVVLERMATVGAITPAEADLARQYPATLVAPAAASASSYFVDWALDQLSDVLSKGLLASGEDLYISTTLDYDLQLLAEAEIERVLAQHGDEFDRTQVALLTTSPDGAIRAMVGGRSYQRSQFNRTVHARRQPGSAFKPFVYMAALEQGYAPENVFYDEPVVVDAWTPGNYGGHYRGPVTLSDALATSSNSVAVKLSETVGRHTIIDMARRSGIGSPLQAVPSLPLGTHEVTLLEMTSAYALLANGGHRVQPFGITDVSDGSGNLLHRHRPASSARVVDSRVIGDMNRMLSNTVLTGTGRRAALDVWPAAGKTGTSQRASDAWFIGYTAELVTGVWLGNDDNSPMGASPTGTMTGGKAPAAIWHNVMQAAHRNREPVDLPYVDAYWPLEFADPEDQIIVQALDETHNNRYDIARSRYNPMARWQRTRVSQRRNVVAQQ